MSRTTISLSEAKQGDILRIVSIDVQGVLRRRLLDLGFVVGNEVEMLRHSPLGDPTAFRVSNTTIALRREESSLIYGELIGGEE
ncbi:ferrous iron transport protein A [Paenibacillus anaericanus]|uniref:Ferrous iron transport protein A n=1 Tax=Paenibacillus anaericanus TaxID=170367 RepID=A0A3S1BMY1_9BACL|nr:FeoA family protein [Paenibacillus anaericanus]MDQ0091959.1 ferrous iron transport protein A [Paenibacillus anaericanus]RUT45272.1 ferrous iron transport protein A [Paenibacillus anaericanus]